MIKIISHHYSENEIQLVSKIGPVIKPVLGFFDPPYNLGKIYSDDVTRDTLSPCDYLNFCSNVIHEASYTIANGGTIWWLCPASHIDFIPKLLNQVGPRLYTIIKKETFSQYQGEKGLTNDYRFLFVHKIDNSLTGKPIEPRFNPNAIRIPSDRQLKYNDKRANPAGRVPSDVWQIRRLQGTADDRVSWHPCQLPPELIHRIILGWSNPGDWCLDGFAGSGNFGVACNQLNRNGILVEGSQTYITKIKERLGMA